MMLALGALYGSVAVGAAQERALEQQARLYQQRQLDDVYRQYLGCAITTSNRLDLAPQVFDVGGKPCVSCGANVSHVKRGRRCCAYCGGDR